MIDIEKIYRHPYFFLLLWSIPLLLLGLCSDQSIMAHDEGYYATRSRLMFETGDWINPWTSPHHKTPGIYWLLAASYQLFGINEIALRLPNLLISLGCVLLIYEITIRTFNPKTALLAASIINLEFLWLRYSYLANPDLITIFLFLFAIFCLIQQAPNAKPQVEEIVIDSAKQNQPYYSFIAGLSLGLMILFRGLLAFVPLFCIAIYLFREKKYDHQFKNRLLFGFLIGLLPTVLWLLLCVQKYNTEIFQSLLMTLFRPSQAQNTGNNILFYFWNTIALCFPWILFVGFGIRDCLIKKNKYCFLLVGIPIMILIVITCYSPRLSHYALMLYPFLAILSARGLDSLLRQAPHLKWQEQYLQIISYGLGVLGVLTTLLIIIGFAFDYLKLAIVDIEVLKSLYIALPIGLGWILLAYLAYRKQFSDQWLASLLVGQWLTFILLLNSGMITDVNREFKAALSEPKISHILETESISILSKGRTSLETLESEKASPEMLENEKTQVLLEYYLPSINYRVNTPTDLTALDYAWIESSYLDAASIPHHKIAEYQNWTFIQRQ